MYVLLKTVKVIFLKCFIKITIIHDQTRYVLNPTVSSETYKITRKNKLLP